VEFSSGHQEVAAVAAIHCQKNNEELNLKKSLVETK
jgi:hypothetical protein